MHISHELYDTIAGKLSPDFIRLSDMDTGYDRYYARVLWDDAVPVPGCYKSLKICDSAPSAFVYYPFPNFLLGCGGIDDWLEWRRFNSDVNSINGYGLFVINDVTPPDFSDLDVVALSARTIVNFSVHCSAVLALSTLDATAAAAAAAATTHGYRAGRGPPSTSGTGMTMLPPSSTPASSSVATTPSSRSVAGSNGGRCPNYDLHAIIGSLFRSHSEDVIREMSRFANSRRWWRNDDRDRGRDRDRDRDDYRGGNSNNSHQDGELRRRVDDLTARLERTPAPSTIPIATVAPQPMAIMQQPPLQQQQPPSILPLGYSAHLPDVTHQYQYPPQLPMGMMPPLATASGQMTPTIKRKHLSEKKQSKTQLVSDSDSDNGSAGTLSALERKAKLRRSLKKDLAALDD